MGSYVLADVSTIGPSTQYEVTNWLFGRGHVAPANVSLSHSHGRGQRERPRERGGRDSRRLLDVGAPRPRRHSSHSGSALDKEGQIKLMPKKGHRRTHSSGHHLSIGQDSGQAAMQKERHVDGKDEVMAGYKRHSVHSKHRRTSSQRSGHRFSFWRGQRDSFTSSAGSGDTLVGSAEDLESLSPSPACLQFSAGSFSKPTPYLPSPSFTDKNSPARDFQSLPPVTSLKLPSPTNLTTSTSPLHITKHTSYLHDKHNDVPPRQTTSSDPNMDEKSRLHKAVNAFKQRKTPTHTISSCPILLLGCIATLSGLTLCLQ